MAPHQEPDEGDGDARERDGAVAEDRLAGERGDDLGDDRHAGQNHDVDGRMRVEPEEVLEQHRVAADLGIEDADLEDAFEQQQDERDAEHRRRQDLDDRGGVDTPHKQRHVEPAHSGGAQLMHGGDEVQAGEDRGEAEDKRGHGHQSDGALGGGGVGSVERPARIDAAEDDRTERQRRPSQVEVVAHQVHARERHVLGAQHERDEEVAQRRRDRRDDEQEHHHRAMQREHLVVGFRRHDHLAEQHVLGIEQRQTHQQGEGAAQQESDQYAHQVHHTDPLVIHCGQPGPQAFVLVQIVDAWVVSRNRVCHICLSPRLATSAT